MKHMKMKWSKFGTYMNFNIVEYIRYFFVPAILAIASFKTELND